MLRRNSKEVGVEVNARIKYSYMLRSRHNNAGQTQDIKTGNRPFENATQFEYLEGIVTNQNFNYRVLHPVARNINCK
jgi:hypothetical protein